YGFVAKEEDFDALAHGPFAWSALVLGLVVAGSVLTAAYSLRTGAGLLGGLREGDERRDPAPAPSGRFLAPAAVLAALTVVLGVAPALTDRWAGGAARALDPAVGSVHLAIWHGVNLALVLSAIALTGGLALYLGRRAVAPVLATGARLPTGGQAYEAV